MFIARATIGIEQMPKRISIWITKKIICLSSVIMKIKQTDTISLNLGVADSLRNLDFLSLNFISHIFCAPSYKIWAIASRSHQVKIQLVSLSITLSPELWFWVKGCLFVWGWIFYSALGFLLHKSRTWNQWSFILVLVRLFWVFFKGRRLSIQAFSTFFQKIYSFFSASCTAIPLTTRCTWMADY